LILFWKSLETEIRNLSIRQAALEFNMNTVH